MLSCQRKWRDELFQLGITVHHDRLCRTDAYGTIACFSHARDLGMTKRARIFKNYFKKRLKTKKNLEEA
jgi:hypothetical protein